LSLLTYIFAVYNITMSAIEILIFLILAYYGIRMLIRLLLPMLFQGIVNKAQQQQGQQQQYHQQRRPEGSVRVDNIPKTKSSIPDSEGDYIDYEEIK
jgi:hypothetical protein